MEKRCAFEIVGDSYSIKGKKGLAAITCACGWITGICRRQGGRILSWVLIISTIGNTPRDSQHITKIHGAICGGICDEGAWSVS